ncbi:putrescine transport system substrate-binding protein [Azospirillum brasilense]|uniref:Putrescine-binding periplasmic protein n=1 Tax=Azospirillum brasilense TaxID=192 RepID=A0A560B5T0_AZOBR|nr:extracellular solute-binding protein [Azospirillum brasilense]TWA67912.1 putrescine transport system substrate-binding protein [Azospirillum brasilense]
MKRFALSVIGAVAAIAIAGPALAQAKKPVNIYIWNDYLGESTLADFTKATGYDTKVDLYDSLELLEQKVLVGKSGYDVIVPTAEPTLSRMIQAKVVAPLDKAKIPNLKNVDPKVLKLLENSDPGNKFAVPYLGGTVGIAIIPEKIKAVAPDVPLDSWDLIFKPEVAKKVAACGITVMDSAIDVIPSVLNYLGLDPNSEKKEDLDKVEKTLLAVRPYIKQFVTGQNINILAGGDACVVMAYNGDAIQGAARAEEAKNGVKVEYITPKEGVQVWWDTLAIPADAPNKEGAHAYINFILDPANTAAISNTVSYANAVPASLASVDEAVKTNPAVFLPENSNLKLFALKSIKQTTDRARTRVWTKVKTGK